MKLNRRQLAAGIPAAFCLRKPLMAANTTGTPGGRLPLERVRQDALAYCEKVHDAGGPYGCYRGGPGKRPDLYASCDIAILRAIMGEDLRVALSDDRRRQWIEHINSFLDRSTSPYDGSYCDTYGHSKLHANGMAISALGALGGKQLYPVRLYEGFNTLDKIVPWLEQLDWAKQWSGSHLFWGGMICFSYSGHCPAGWLDRVFGWLDAHLDERTGWWKKGVPHADRHQPLGGSVHILPLYEHHHCRFPYPERVIDSVLALQLENGRWQETTNIHVMSYLELDALYALYLMRGFAPGYREADMRKAMERYGRLVCRYYETRRAELYQLHPHSVLAAVSTFGLLSRLAAAMFPSNSDWSDIFSDRRFHNTSQVESA